MSRLGRFIGVLSLAIATCALAGVFASRASAQAATPLRVVIKPLTPFVMFEGDRNTGFSIELWEDLARRLDRKFVYVRVDTVRQQLDAVRASAADVAITGISITREREREVDFSHPYFDAGLQILTPAHANAPSLLSLLGTFLSGNVLQIIGVLAAFIVAIAHLFWLVERRTDPTFPKGYVAGFGESLWWACVTVVTVGYGDRVPRGAWGRLVAVFWMFLGLFLISNFTATITSELTLRQLQGSIRSLDDLGDKHVLAVEGSTSERFLTARGMRPVRVVTIEDAYARLGAGEADAVVYDAPVLQHYALREGAGKVRLAGGVFNREAYGIALPVGSPLREELNQALLQMREDGTYARLYTRWFGAE